FTYASEHRDEAALNDALESLFWFCMMRNRYLEGEMLFKQTEAQFGGALDDPSALLCAQIKLRRLWLRRWREGSFATQPDIIRQLEELLPLFQRTNHAAGLAICLLLLGDARLSSEDGRLAL